MRKIAQVTAWRDGWLAVTTDGRLWYGRLHLETGEPIWKAIEGPPHSDPDRQRRKRLRPGVLVGPRRTEVPDELVINEEEFQKP